MSPYSWLLLLHQIPPKPSYFRAKVLRRLTQVGALPIKNSAYMLPVTDDTIEDFAWIGREISAAGGASWLFRVQLIEGMTQEQIEEAFRRLHEPELQAMIEQTNALLEHAPHLSDESLLSYRKIARRLEEVKRIDFFGSPLRDELEGLLRQFEEKGRTVTGMEKTKQGGRVWITRKGVKVDRIASAWLIRRFIDPAATLHFVDSGHVHTAGELRFDMFSGEYTHRGDLCTFEVLVNEFGLGSDGALAAIGEMVHDIDLKEDRYQRPETSGFGRMIEGLCAQTAGDEQRVERGAVILDSLYQSFLAATT